MLGTALLEDFGQQIEELLPEGWVYGVQPTVEAALCDRFLDVAVVVQKRAAYLDVAAEEGRRDESHRHYFGAREANLRIVLVSDDFQELLAQVIGGDYGIFHCVSSRSREKVLAAFGSGGYCLPR